MLTCLNIHNITRKAQGNLQGTRKSHKRASAEAQNSRGTPQGRPGGPGEDQKGPESSRRGSGEAQSRPRNLFEAQEKPGEAQKMLRRDPEEAQKAQESSKDMWLLEEIEIRGRKS